MLWWLLVGLSSSCSADNSSLEKSSDKHHTDEWSTSSFQSDQSVVTDQTAPGDDNFQQLWDTMLSAVTKSSTSMTLAFTLLSLLLCLCLANTFLHSQAEAFRMGFHRRVVKPVVTPFKRILSSEEAPPGDELHNISREPTLTDDDKPHAKSLPPSSSNSSTNKTKSGFDLATTFDMDFLNDLSPPFCPNTRPEDLTAHLESPDVTHFCFLLHGHRGLSRDLTYMQVQMQRAASERKRKGMKREESEERATSPTWSLSPPQEQVEESNPKEDPIHDMVVHNSICNEGKTTDGIQNAGDRLVEEMRQVIEDEMIKRHPELEAYLKALRAAEDSENVDMEDEHEPLAAAATASSLTGDQKGLPKIYDITVSILGNSLGGLYGRYAVAKLIERHCVLDSAKGCWVLDGRFRLHLNIFCTTATPHLGISRHTYVKIPRTAEIGVAHAMGDTGRDLFRLNDLLHSMATDPIFLKPLSKFRKRIAYANAYGTDFPVPASTAAFLSENSTYPHHVLLETNAATSAFTPSGSEAAAVSLDTNNIASSENQTNSHGGMVIATLHTHAQFHGDSDDENSEVDQVGDEVTGTSSDTSSTSLNSQKPGDQQDELDQMSRSLDQLGWKKVFVDIRRELPGAALPTSFWMRRQSSDDSKLENKPEQDPDADTDTDTDTADVAAFPKLQLLENRSVVESREVATAMASPQDNRVALPLGHNMIVAFSRSRLMTFMNKGGRPIVDALARELVEEIFTWDHRASYNRTKNGEKR